jgi:hypothetical protein
MVQSWLAREKAGLRNGVGSGCPSTANLASSIIPPSVSVTRIFKGESVGSVIRAGAVGGENLAGGHAGRLGLAGDPGGRVAVAEDDRPLAGRLH